jgi:hypothetical protein
LAHSTRTRSPDRAEAGSTAPRFAVAIGGASAEAPDASTVCAAFTRIAPVDAVRAFDSPAIGISRRSATYSSSFSSTIITRTGI